MFWYIKKYWFRWFMGKRFTFTRTGEGQISQKFYNFQSCYWQSLCEHSFHTGSKLDTQTYENICHGKIEVTNSESISASSADKISFDLSLQANNSKSLLETNTFRKVIKWNPDRLIKSHPNINSLWNKLEFVALMVKDNADILMLPEAKLDSSFP